MAACVVFDPDRGVGILRYASRENAEAGSLRLLDDDTTAVVDRSSSKTGRIGWRAGAGTAAGLTSAGRPRCVVQCPFFATRPRPTSRVDGVSSSSDTPARRRYRSLSLDAIAAASLPHRRAPCPASAPSRRPSRRRRRRSAGAVPPKVLDVTAESEGRGVRLEAQAAPQATQRLLRESRAAHDEDLRRADRRFEEEKD